MRLGNGDSKETREGGVQAQKYPGGNKLVVWLFLLSELFRSSWSRWLISSALKAEEIHEKSANMLVSGLHVSSAGASTSTCRFTSSCAGERTFRRGGAAGEKT